MEHLVLTIEKNKSKWNVPKAMDLIWIELKLLPLPQVSSWLKINADTPLWSRYLSCLFTFLLFVYNFAICVHVICLFTFDNVCLQFQHWLRSNGWQNENRRLLPDSPNGVHIIDGVTHRYYLGIIDIFTAYSFRQRFGRLLKSLLYCSTDHSSAPPEEYANRFIDFLEGHLI